LGGHPLIVRGLSIYIKGNAEWKKGETARAEMLYFSSLSTFPTPDALNNIAACALKLNQQVVHTVNNVANPRH
jgi:hypothetical protein